MKLLFYDKFFDSLIKLPRGVQKKVVEFQKKFRDNSKSAGIHLEPISTFKDKSLRSARVDQTYRAIIKAPDSGDIYYLLWVDHHDKAYDWAMNKVFQWNDETQTMQMFTAPEILAETNNEATKGPLEYEPFFSKLKKDQLLKIGVPEVLLPSIEKIDTLDDLEKVETYIPADVFENLFYLLDGANIEQLIFEVEEGKVKEEHINAKVSSINNQRSFIELTDDSLFNEIFSGSLQKWKYYLHPSQRKLVTNNAKGPIKVSGGAGTGKTVAALHRLKFLTENKQAGENFLFTTYTKALTANLGQLIHGLNISTANLTVSNIDKLVRDLIIKYDLLEDDFKVFELDSVKDSTEIWEELLASELTIYSPEFLETEYKEVILYHHVQSLEQYIRTSRKGRGKPISRRQRKEIWQYFNKFTINKEKNHLYYKDELYNKLFDYLKKEDKYLYDYCIVDELQDFSNVELRVIRKLVPEKMNDLFMVGDPMQKIYDRRINFSSAGINIRGKRSKRLRINYRTTEEIKRLALSVIKDCHYDNFDGEEEEKTGYVSLFHGNIPSYKVFKTKSDEVEFVLNQIKTLYEGGYQYEDFAICARTKDGIKDFRKAFHKEGVAYSDNTIRVKSAADSLTLLTFHKIKGLEFKHVFMVDVNERNIPKIPFGFEALEKSQQESYLQNEKSLIYVALSRAIENVFISGVGRKSAFFKMEG